MKKKMILLFGALVSLALGGCDARHCAEFPKEFQWLYFPYSHGQQLAFVGDAGDTVSFSVAEVSLSSPYDIAYNVKEMCAPTMLVLVQGEIDSISFNLHYSVFNSRTREYSGDWTPADNLPYHFEPFIVFKELDWPYEYVYQYVTVFNGNVIDTFSAIPPMTSLHDTLCFIWRHDGYRLGPILDTLVVVKNRGLVSFSSRAGQKYELTE